MNAQWGRYGARKIKFSIKFCYTHTLMSGRVLYKIENIMKRISLHKILVVGIRWLHRTAVDAGNGLLVPNEQTNKRI